MKWNEYKTTDVFEVGRLYLLQHNGIDNFAIARWDGKAFYKSGTMLIMPKRWILIQTPEDTKKQAIREILWEHINDLTPTEQAVEKIMELE